MISDEIFLKNLTQAVLLLSSNADIQINTISDLKVSFDELGLIFDDAIICLDEKFSEKLISEKEYKDLIELDVMLSGISGQENTELWTKKAFKSDYRWKEIREKAALIISNHNWVQTKVLEKSFGRIISVKDNDI